jgi:Cu(I)/Ag(I) efflux system membrane fusion protein
MNNAVQVVKTLFLRLRFIFVFIVIALIVGRWSWIMNVADRITRPKTVAEAATAGFEWFCPMHPTVVRGDNKEKCPLCGMPLSKRKHGEVVKLPAGVLSRLQLTPFRIQQAGVAVEEIGFRPLVRELRTVGTMEWDDRRMSHPSVRVAGRVDELYVNFVGARVKKGDPLYKLYSPDLSSTQVEYLLALKAIEETKDASADAVGRAKRLAESSRERLRLWGLTDEQLDLLEKSRQATSHVTITSPVAGLVIKKAIDLGHYVVVGEDPWTLVDDSVMWLQAEIFERDLALVKLDQQVELSSEAWPGAPVLGRIVFIAPTVEPETRTTKVRIEVPNPGSLFKAGMYMTAVFRVPLTGQKGPDVKQSPSPARDIYTCEMHPEEVYDQPGVCIKFPCQGPPPMKLAKEPIPAGSRLMYVCPEHPDEISDKPGTCPRSGKKLAYRIVKDSLLPSPERILAVPFSALIDTGLRKVVFLERAYGTFDSVEIEVGPRAGEYYPVLKGLAAGDRVVVQGAFLLDAETRLNPAAAAAYFGAEMKK